MKRFYEEPAATISKDPSQQDATQFHFSKPHTAVAAAKHTHAHCDTVLASVRVMGFFLQMVDDLQVGGHAHLHGKRNHGKDHMA